MRRQILLSICVLVLATTLLRGHEPDGASLEVGKPAPQLHIADIVQPATGDQVDLASLRGRVVVLEFWATWCGPCVAAIPHLNELATRLADEPVTFLAITGEDPAKVAAFTAQRPMKAIVAIDAERKTQTAYEATAIPRTVLIDARGNVAAITHPTAVTERTIRAMLDGNPPDLLVPDITDEGRRGTERDADPLFEVSIVPHTGSAGLWVDSDDALRSAGQPLDVILANIWGVPRSRILDPDGLLPGDALDVRVQVPAKARALRNTLLEQAIEVTFALDIEEAEEELDVLVLTMPDGPGPGLRHSEGRGSVSSAHRLLLSDGAPLMTLANMLEPYVGRPIVCDVDDPRMFSFRFSWDADSPESVIESAANQLGFRLTPARRSLRVLQITSANAQPVDNQSNAE